MLLIHIYVTNKVNKSKCKIITSIYYAKDIELAK